MSPKLTLWCQQHICRTDWLFQKCVWRLHLIRTDKEREYLVLLPLSHSTRRRLLHQPAQCHPVSAHLLKGSKLSSSCPSHKKDKQHQLAHSRLSQVYHLKSCCVISIYGARVRDHSCSKSNTSGYTPVQRSHQEKRAAAWRFQFNFPCKPRLKFALGKAAWSGLSTWALTANR